MPVSGMGVTYNAVAELQLDLGNGRFQRALPLTDVDGYDLCHVYDHSFPLRSKAPKEMKHR